MLIQICEKESNCCNSFVLTYMLILVSFTLKWTHTEPRLYTKGSSFSEGCIMYAVTDNKIFYFNLIRILSRNNNNIRTYRVTQEVFFQHFLPFFFCFCLFYHKYRKLSTIRRFSEIYGKIFVKQKCAIECVLSDIISILLL